MQPPKTIFLTFESETKIIKIPHSAMAIELTPLRPCHVDCCCHNMTQTEGLTLLRPRNIIVESRRAKMASLNCGNCLSTLNCPAYKYSMTWI